MSTGNALFLRNSLEAEPSFFAALDVPMNRVETELCSEGTGFLDAFEHGEVKWERHREMGSISVLQDDSLRYGQCVDVVRVHPVPDTNITPCFILPESGTVPTVQDALVRLKHSTSFDTAGAQANLWLSAYSEIKYQEFMGTIDREFVARSMNREFQPGDVFLIEVSPTLCCGVLELGDPRGGSEWKSVLYWPIRPPRDPTDIALSTVHMTRLDGFSVTVRREFATVLTATARS